MTQFTHEQKLDISRRSIAAAQAGDYEAEVKIMQELPLSPQLAKSAKEIWGADYLRNSGWDLSEAEAAYGKDWLDK